MTPSDAQWREYMEFLRSSGSANLNRTPKTTTAPSLPDSEASVMSFVSTLKSGAVGLKNAAEQTLDGWRRASDIGIGFNNDAIGLRSSVGQTRLSVEEWEAVVRRGSFGMTALAGTVSDSAKVFNRMSRDFSDSTAADELRRLGYTEKEYNEVLALSLAGRKGLDIYDERSRKAAIDAAGELAVEMDKMSKLTGKSRQELIREQEERNRDVRTQAAIELEVRKGGKDAAATFNKLSQEASAVGVDKLARAMYAGRGLSEKEQEQYAILGEAGPALYSAINELKAADRSGDPARKAAAEAQYKAAVAQVAAVQGSETYLNILAQNTGKFTDAGVEMSSTSQNYRLGLEKVAQEMKLDVTKPADVAKAKEELERRVKNAQKGLDEAGNPIAGANVTAVGVEGAARLKDASAALWKLAETSNTQLGQSREVLILLRELANRKVIDGKETSSRERIIPGLSEADRALAAGTLSKDLPVILKNSVIEGFNSVYGPGKEILVNMAKVAGQSATDFFKSLTGAATKEVPPATEGRAGGSLGAVGKFIEDWGNETLVRLHGKEGVITENQLGSLIGGFKAEMESVQNPSNKVLEQLMGIIPKGAPETAQSTTVQNVATATTLDDVKGQLELLNTQIRDLVTYTADVANNSSQQIRATKQLSGNLLV